MGFLNFKVIKERALALRMWCLALRCESGQCLLHTTKLDNLPIYPCNHPVCMALDLFTWGAFVGTKRQQLADISKGESELLGTFDKVQAAECRTIVLAIP